MAETQVLRVTGTQVIIEARGSYRGYKVALTAVVTPANSAPMPEGGQRAANSMNGWLGAVAVEEALGALDFGDKRAVLDGDAPLKVLTPGPWEGDVGFVITTIEESGGTFVVYAMADALPHLAAVGRSRLIYRVSGVPLAAVVGLGHGMAVTWKVRDLEPGNPGRSSPYTLEAVA